MKPTVSALILTLVSVATQASPLMPWMPDVQQVLDQIYAAAPIEPLPSFPAPVFQMNQDVFVNGKLMQTIHTIYNRPKQQLKAVSRTVSPTGQESYLDFVNNGVRCVFMNWFLDS